MQTVQRPTTEKPVCHTDHNYVAKKQKIQQEYCNFHCGKLNNHRPTIIVADAYELGRIHEGKTLAHPRRDRAQNRDVSKPQSLH